MNKKILFGTLTLGLVAGAVIGFQSIRSAAPVVAESEAKGIVQAVRGKRAVVTETDVNAMLASVRSFTKNDKIDATFRDSKWNPYFGAPQGKTEGQIVNLVDKEGWLYTVALDTHKVIQIGPQTRGSEFDPFPVLDFTAKYTKAELKDYAISWLKTRGVDVEKETAGLEFNITTKDDRGYFFRWYDPKATDINGDMRFLQVGFTIGGSLLSYANTL